MPIMKEKALLANTKKAKQKNGEALNTEDKMFKSWLTWEMGRNSFVYIYPYFNTQKYTVK